MLFAYCAAAFIAFWWVYLFSGLSEGQTAAEQGWHLLVFSFTESEAPWAFWAMALLPMSFAVLATSAWRAKVAAWRIASWPAWLAIASALLSVLFLWPVALSAFPALLLAMKRRDT